MSKLPEYRFQKTFESSAQSSDSQCETTHLWYQIVHNKSKDDKQKDDERCVQIHRKQIKIEKGVNNRLNGQCQEGGKVSELSWRSGVSSSNWSGNCFRCLRFVSGVWDLPPSLSLVVTALQLQYKSGVVSVCEFDARRRTGAETLCLRLTQSLHPCVSRDGCL